MFKLSRLPVALKFSCTGFLLSFLLFCTGLNPVKAQMGTYLYDAIPAGTMGIYGGSNFYDSRYLDNYYYYNSVGNYGPDMWYSFNVAAYSDLQLTTCGSYFNTVIHVYDEYMNEIAYGDYSPMCGAQGEIIQSFAPGNYYVVVEGNYYGSNTGYVQFLINSVSPVAPPDGATMANPIVAGTMGSCGGSFSDSRSNGVTGMGDEYGQPNNDIYYQFTLSSASTVTLSHCGSGFDTYMHLLDASGNLIASNDEGSLLSPCLGAEAFIQMSLPAGTYYVVSEGSGYNMGNIVTNIHVSSSTPTSGTNMATAINAGTFSASGSFTDTKSNADPCLGNDYGQSSNDIYYKFVLNGTADVALSHCGSGFDTYMHLLDASGNLIIPNDDSNVSPCPGLQAYISITLTAGTYYMVSEGYGAGTGNITSSINVVMAAPPPVITYAATGPLSFITGTAITAMSPTNTGGAVSLGGQTTSTFAGNAAGGFTNGTGVGASFYNPLNAAVDPSGNVYVADAGNHSIRKITPAGVVTTFAGAGYGGYMDGAGTSARFQHPSALALDASGNLFVADQHNNRIRKITPAGVVSTFAGSGTAGSANGTGTGASFYYPMGLAFDASGNLIVSDGWNNKLRKITPSGVVTTFAGTGVAGATNSTLLTSSFSQPMGLVFDPEGNLFVADRSNNMIRKISTSGNVTTLAGSGTRGYANGPGPTAMFAPPNNLVRDNEGNFYVADQSNNIIRKITPGGEVSAFAGNTVAGTVNGTGSVVRMNSPFGIARGADGVMYVIENAPNLIRKIVIVKPYTITPALPAGLVFNENTGEISGTPSEDSPPIDYTISAGNSSGTGTTVLNITVETTQQPNIGSDNWDKNWVMSKSYDEDGNLIAEAKAFFDNNGHATQMQVKNRTEAQVLASQVIYDVQQRPVLNTLVAPISNSEFNYKSNFIATTSNVPYSYKNFDKLSQSINKTNNPDPIGNTKPGTLGWYYSNNNTLESRVATTAYPYSRSQYNEDGTNSIKRTGDIGEQLMVNSGHTATANSFSVVNELSHYKQVRDKFFSEAVVGSSASLSNKATQNFYVDQNGVGQVTISDLSGKETLMSSSTNPGWLTVSNSVQLDNPPRKYSYSVLVGADLIMGGGDNPNAGGIVMYSQGFSVDSKEIVSIYLNGEQVYNGIGKDFSANVVSLHSNVYVVESNFPFTISDGYQCENCPSRIAEPKKPFHYFSLLQPSAVTITGTNYQLYDMLTEQQISATGILPAGYYKLVTTDAATTLTYTNSYSNISYNFYNQLGQIIATIAPEGVKQLLSNGLDAYNNLADVPFLSTNEYDLQGRLIAKRSADAGRTEFVYRNDGNVRFSQNAEQAKTGRFSYTNYDRWGRSFESGEYLPGDISFSSAKTNEVLLEDTSLSGGLTGGTRYNFVKTHYDYPDNSHGLGNYNQDEAFLKAEVSWTENENSKTWYNYDGQGRIVWLLKSIVGLGVKTINYSYDARGNTIKVDYQKNDASERFIYEYEYDADGRLHVAYTSTNPALTRTEQAKYFYYLHGPLKRIELAGNLQGIDYTYTPQGWLKAINHPDTGKDPGNDGLSNGFAPDAFGMTLEYFNGDYIRDNTGINSLITGTTKSYYNGNISAQSWRSKKPQSIINTYGTTVSNPKMFTYEYDNEYQFNNNKFGSPNYTNNSFTETANANREFNLTYDANGNIKSLSRTDQAGNIKSQFTGDNYHYQTGTNKLTSVDNYADYIYDDLGQMTGQSRVNGAGYYLNYNINGKITGIYSDVNKTQLRVSFTYDESGQRILKTDHLQNITTYYVYDGVGNLLSIYDNNGSTLQQKELPLYASSRIGLYKRSDNSYQYELNDNLGNVRVVINQSKINGAADVVYYSDYYPFGSPLTLVNNDYRYGYQGQFAEVDKETGWNNFDFRMYDSEIGRWMSTDPMGQYYSPYVGMGNNPVSRVDPDGGFDGEYEKNAEGKWIKTSTVGDDIGVDFYHDFKNGKQITYITDRNGNWNSILNGRKYLSGEVRDYNHGWWNIYDEWADGYGPEKSIFNGKHPSVSDITLNFLFEKKEKAFIASDKSKKRDKVDFWPILDNFLTGTNMQVQMMGSYNVSFYKLGNKAFALIMDSKSMTSFYYHLPVTNHERNTRSQDLMGNWHDNIFKTNTYQTYLHLSK
ncbi:putative Ig domain-containing protein [Pedobacter sp. MC2016-14]|uniref:RHS repeat-associated core domain-containing protein n=1 Tax=Pedobacter sp. MC2016-14 TaxID=2897327 RepID=UPI001E3E1766|nr:RHS repeat-associated core domain-containing protein [Pedobacter sp. MC2016-14]MCD0487346.1 putative Ig domain-containing protein [Pedobacter sp. MC2016-14]